MPADALEPLVDWDRIDAVYAGSLRPFTGALDAAELMNEAETVTGLADWGGERWSEAGFRRRLSSLCAALEAEANLSGIGRSRAHGRLHAMLVSRLRTCAFRTARPTSSKIVAPLVGTGLPRSGTSFLQQLLAQDPDHLAPTTAQAMIPVPPPGTPEEERRRIALVDRLLAAQGLDSPEVNAIHPLAADRTDEDLLVQEAACGSLYQAFFNVPTFVAGLKEDVPDFYGWQKGWMELMQFSQPRKRWVLKAPAHMSNLAALHETFPDARVFVNHRDPAKVIPSLASLFVTFQRLNTAGSAVDPKRLGPALLAGQMQAVAKMNAWRDAHPHVRIVDIQFLDLVRDPIGQAERLYEAWNLPMSARTKQAMSAFLADHRHGQSHQGAKHAYRLDEFGLSADKVEEHSGEYVARYRVSKEAVG